MPPPRRPAPKPPPPRPAAKAVKPWDVPHGFTGIELIPAAKPAPRPAARPVASARAALSTPHRPAGRPVTAPAKPRPAARVKTSPAARAPLGPAAAAAELTWYAVTASREVLGGNGSCRRIEPRGYSELSTNPGAPLRQLDFAGLGRLPCLTGLYIRNPANGKTVGAVKQDIGAGSSFHPVMGLYPQTLRDLGLDTGGGEFHVQVRRQDGRALHPAHGTAIRQAAGGESGPAATPQQPAYYNPFKHANVRGERIDQGVDYAGTGYLTAIADGIISERSDGAWGVYGNYLEYKITQPGELENVYIYYAEGITPVVHQEERIRGGARICDLIPGWHSGIECGFGAGNGKAWTYYRYHDGAYNEKTATRPGIAFDNLIRRLGGPAGRIEGTVVGRFPEFMQSGEPAPGVTLDATGGGPDSSTGLVVDVGSAAQAYDFGDSFHSAFVQLQRGLTQAHSHSHAAFEWARKQTYLKKAD